MVDARQEAVHQVQLTQKAACGWRDDVVAEADGDDCLGDGVDVEEVWLDDFFDLLTEADGDGWVVRELRR